MKMKTLLKAIVLSILFTGVSLRAEIREASSMKDALEGVEEGTLVALDLDNTVMMTPQTIGNEEWFDYLLEKYIQENFQKGLPKKEAIDKGVNDAVKRWVDFHRTAKTVLPVEAETSSLIAGVQARGIWTMALTGRSEELLEGTREELKSLGINLALRAPYPKKVSIVKKGAKTIYQDGLLLVGPFTKGEALVQFLEKTKIKPKKIIFIDNKQKHLEVVSKALEPLKIPFFGRRHNVEDAKIAAMDKSVADIQTKYFFGEPLSNEDAKKLITK